MPALSEGFNVSPAPIIGTALANLPNVVTGVPSLQIPGGFSEAFVRGIAAGTSIGESIGALVEPLTPAGKERLEREKQERELKKKELELRGKEIGMRGKALEMEEKMLPTTMRVKEKEVGALERKLSKEESTDEAFQKQLREHPNWYTVGPNGYERTEEWLKANDASNYQLMQAKLKQAKTEQDRADMQNEYLRQYNDRLKSRSATPQPSEAKPSAGALAPKPQADGETFGERHGGAGVKKTGWLGKIPTADGTGVMTEKSVGVEINGKETEIPSIVPTLNKDEVKYLADGGDPRQNPEIMRKAIEHAEDRIAEGLSPFWEGKEDNALIVDEEGNVLTPDTEAPSEKKALSDVRVEMANRIGEIKKRQGELLNDIQLASLAGPGMKDVAAEKEYADLEDELKKTRERAAKMGGAELTPAEKASARMYAQYKTRWTPWMDRHPRGELMKQYIEKINPSWEANNYDVATAKKKDFFGGGMTNRQIVQANTAIHHIAGALDKIKKLDNTSVKSLNKLFAAIGTELRDDPRWQEFTVRQTGISEELAKLLKGGVASEKEVEQWMKAFSATNGPKVMEGALKEALDLMAGRIISLKEDFENTMGPTDIGKFINKSSQKALKEHGIALEAFGGEGGGDSTPPEGTKDAAIEKMRAMLKEPGIEKDPQYRRVKRMVEQWDREHQKQPAASGGAH